MPAPARHRFQLVEYGEPVDLVGQLVAAAAVDRDKAKRLVSNAGERAARSLRMVASPLQHEGTGIRAVDFAGMIRLGPGLELEVTPKFLGRDELHSRWREDFYFLANLSRHGRLLASERLRASGHASKDLASLIARSVTGMYWDNRRRPLRSYRRAKIDDVFIEGDVDPVDIRLPGPDGFHQEVVRYDRQNQFNATIRQAAIELLSEVGEPDAAAGLLRVIQDLPSQPLAAAIRRKRSVPGRSCTWQPLVDLSNDVLDGFGLSYKQGNASAPGYLLNTWQAWEHLLTIAVRLVYGASLVASQKEYLLGTRTGHPSGMVTSVRVYPDLMVAVSADGPQFIIDAKYKTNAQKGPVRISEGDTYEAIAFAKASLCERVVLAYPAASFFPAEDPPPLGSAKLFEKLQVGTTQIYGVYIEARGISKRSGVQEFGVRLKSSLERILKEAAS